MIVRMTKAAYLALPSSLRRKRKDGIYTVLVNLAGGGHEWRPVKWDN